MNGPPGASRYNTVLRIPGAWQAVLLRALLIPIVLWTLPLRAQDPASQERCLKCHEPVARQLAKRVVHPVDCAACHIDHTLPGISARRPYLTAAPPALCLGCHSAESERLVQAHQRQPFQNASCVGCHDPHASNAAKLIYAIPHGPFAGRHCDECHSDPENGHVTLNAHTVRDLCLNCHVLIGNRVAESRSGHRTLPCTACHTPHASDYRPHLKAGKDPLCRQCHTHGPEGAFSH